MHLSGEKVLEAYGVTVENLLKWGGKVHYIPSSQALDPLGTQDNWTLPRRLPSFPSAVSWNTAKNTNCACFPLIRKCCRNSAKNWA